MSRHPLVMLAATCALCALLAAPTAAAPRPTAAPTPSVAMASAALTAGPRLVSPSSANARIRRVLRSRVKSRVLGRNYAMAVWDAQSASFVFKRRTKRAMRGASTTKVLTAVGVLATLGADHRLATTVRAGAGPEEVVLVAGGDPLLTSADLRQLARRTAIGLGRLPADPPEPSATPTDPAVPDGTTAPSVGPASPATVVVRADDSLFRGRTRSAGWRSSWRPSQVRPVGAFARDDRKVRDATRDAGAYFAAALRTLGVPATYAGEATADPGLPLLAEIPGHTVGQAVSHMLLVSDNDTAEMLFRHIAVGRGLPGTFSKARTALRDVLHELGVPLELVRIVDGSGLSLKGRLTVRSLTSALAVALSPDRPELAGVRGWLPVAGRTGTLKAAYGRFTTWPSRCAAGRVSGKTGTLARAISLAGYATGADGRTKVYVSIVNARPTRYSRLTTRRAVDRTVSSITGCW